MGLSPAAYRSLTSQRPTLLFRLGPLVQAVRLDFSHSDDAIARPGLLVGLLERVRVRLLLVVHGHPEPGVAGEHRLRALVARPIPDGVRDRSHDLEPVPAPADRLIVLALPAGP